MEFISAGEASKKWGVSVRRVQYLCSQGLIPGVGKMGRMWLVPKDAEAPNDHSTVQQESAESSRYKVFELPNRSYDADIKTESGNYALFYEVIRCLPQVLHIFRPDGTLFYGNDEFRKLLGFINDEKYNSFKKLNVITDINIDRWGLRDAITRAFLGETVHVYDVKVPIEEFPNVFGSKKEKIHQIIYQNFHSFPIADDHGKLMFVATLFEISRSYNGKEEIIKGKEYIENHWRDKFSLEAAADACSLSRGYFSRLFKSHTGVTPHQYHQNIKISHVQDMLLNPNISVAQAFAECGIEYNSHYLEIFRERTGMSPLEYRKKSK